MNGVFKEQLIVGILLGLLSTVTFSETNTTQTVSKDANLSDESELTPESIARWYEVEVIIFSQNTVVENDPESWPTYPVIDQSIARIELTDPDIPETNEESIDELSESVTDELAITEIEPTEEILPAGPDDLIAFEKLAPEKHQLAALASKLEKDSRIRILFHESWNHPIMPADLAMPIVIRGGANFGNLDELSGLLKIHVSRYLHVETHLYLTDMVESTEPFDLVTGNPDFTILELNDTINQPELASFEGLALFSAKEFNSVGQPLDLNDEYIYQVAVNSAFMQEKRRLKSKELHYIDNPKFGLLINFTPVTFAEPVESLEN